MSIVNPTNDATAAIRYDVVKNDSQSKSQGRDVYCPKVQATDAMTRVTTVPYPEIQMVYNGLTGNPNTVASQGPLIVMGRNFIWNEAAEDEGFFTDATGEYRACELTSLDAACQFAFLHIVHELEAGAIVRLYFITRNTGNGERLVIDYDVPIICEVNPDAVSTEG